MTGRVNCATCGMVYSISAGRCPKCDARPFSENRRATLTIDIAHGGQRVHEALVEFQEALEMAQEQGYGYLRLIVGSGRINQELARDLEAAIWRGQIKNYQYEDPNKGAYLVRMTLDE
jgi:hypothetical protein